MSAQGSLSISHSDLLLASTTCEVRYDFAFLIFDRTGAICLESKNFYPELKVLQASPAATTFESSPYSFAVEQLQSRAFCRELRHDSKEFGEATAHFFEIVLEQLEVRVLTRIGLRQVYFQPFAGRDDADAVVRALKLQPGAADVYFGISNPAREVILRWESKDLGAMLHVASVPGNLALQVVDVLQSEKGIEKNHESAVIIDVDFYTTASTLRSQWHPSEWVAQSSHVVKKGIRGFLQKC
jgi:hypothetical protein